MACPNGSVPLVLPWTNNSVSATGTITARGISFSVGTPPQPFSLTPSTLSDNLFLNSAVECVAATNSSCIGHLGGIYDSAASTSFVQDVHSTWGGSRDSVALGMASSFIFFDDAMTFGLEPTANKLSSFPIYTTGSTDASADPFMKDNADSKATLPLGMNSTFLNHLVDTAQASSRTFGLWVGSESEETPQDGLLVIGGYDESRLKSAATTFPMFSDCPTCAILTAITYDIGGKSTTLFSNTTETLIVHLDPFSSDILLPAHMIQNLASAEETAVWNETSRRFEFPATTPPVGTITITISDTSGPLEEASIPPASTYTTVIPASELYNRPRAYDSTGVLEVTNATVYNMAVTNQTSLITLGTLGIPFFTQNYLVVDPDARNFQLAPAIVTPADPEGADAKVKQICRILPTVKQKSQVPLLAGAIVGAIVGTLLLVCLVYYTHRRKKHVNPRHSHGKSETATTTSADPICERVPTQASPENKSLELPLQGRHPSIMSLRDSTTFPSPFPNRVVSKGSGRKDSENKNPRRGLLHDVFQKVDEANDGRLLDERPMGLCETIHSSKTLPRMAAEHKV